ncbi:ABC transporter, ATP-binding protein [Alteracholeplasma palmae J233]|uniref:ABC transporter, ATP-binding protein n=1 Tax=Alteracholeplasma palmae (strain ATCC 49389 / J233) TaxID=1318466 RepID=U4KKY5_ALTPJ|nr:ATP-binding cassette domain-containing protein [Alteracholeplasma palmae]CCV64363.1 ABC transporter, ATP-binding protein [Alteracholeplasma palmae J233]
MIQASNISLGHGKDVLFEDVNIRFTAENCYGLIGANGAGKSTFLKILAKELEPTTGEIIVDKGKRISFLKQDHFAYNEYSVLDTVIMGNKELYKVMKEKDELYMKEEFTDEDGIKAGELEALFAEMDGWNSESDAAILLSGLGVSYDKHDLIMKDLDSVDKVKVLLAQSLFGNPDILLLDEPTNHLDQNAIVWLEEFLINFKNTIIVVSHDRHFINKVCTHIADIDYGKIQIFTGNYDFWYESSQLILKQQKDSNKKKEEKVKELQDFVARFSANASKSKQATSRKKLLEKITIDELKPSNRKYPFIEFKPEREIGQEVLVVDKLSKTIDGVKVLDNVSFILSRTDKVALVGPNELAKTTLFDIISGKIEPDSGTFKWGVTTKFSYFIKDHNYEFENNLNIFDWLMQYSKTDEIAYVRGFLGRMLFSGDDVTKKVRILSGGEKVRCMLSKMMMAEANVLLLDEPTNHLDMESITALNNSLEKFNGVIIFTSQDHQLVDTTANKLIEINKDGTIKEYMMNYEEYLKLEK